MGAFLILLTAIFWARDAGHIVGGSHMTLERLLHALIGDDI